MPLKSGFAHGEFCWVDLVARDMEAAVEFYGKLFNWRALPQDTQGGPPYAVFELGDHAVAGVGEMHDDVKSLGAIPVWNSYVNVEDIVTTTKRAHTLGASVTVLPMKVVEAGWMSCIRDPTGGNVALWQKNNHPGAALLRDPSSLCWNELATGDVDGAKAFYGALFGWTFRDHEEARARYYIIEGGDQQRGGLLQITEEFAAMPPCWSVYFAVDDADRAARLAELLGGHCLVAPFDIPAGRMAVVRDPQGGVFNIIRLTG